MPDAPQVSARFWHSSDGYTSRAFQFAKRVHTGWTVQLGASEIQPRDGNNTFIRDNSYNNNEELLKRCVNQIFSLPLSNNCNGAAESQLHLIVDSTQFWSIGKCDCWCCRPTRNILHSQPCRSTNRRRCCCTQTEQSCNRTGVKRILEKYLYNLATRNVLWWSGGIRKTIRPTQSFVLRLRCI